MLIATTQRTFSSDAAQQAIGYVPKVPMAEALQRTLASYPHLRSDVDAAPVAAAKKAS
jgi:hypothetical protein